jgi:hypothetical protein
MGLKQIHVLREKGFSSPLKGIYFEGINVACIGRITLKYCVFADKSCLETSIDSVPSMKDTQLKDIPFARSTDPNDIMLDFAMEAIESAVKAPTITLHTFDELEPSVSRDLSMIYLCVYAVGPFQLLLNRIQEDDLKSIGYNLWEEESAGLQWWIPKNQTR